MKLSIKECFSIFFLSYIIMDIFLSIIIYYTNESSFMESSYIINTLTMYLDYYLVLIILKLVVLSLVIMLYIFDEYIFKYACILGTVFGFIGYVFNVYAICQYTGVL